MLRESKKTKEPLIKSEVPAIQGCIAKFNDSKSLNLRGKQKSHFCFPCSDKSWMDLIRGSLKQPYRTEQDAVLIGIEIISRFKSCVGKIQDVVAFALAFLDAAPWVRAEGFDADVQC